MPAVHLVYQDGKYGAVAQITTKTGRLLYEGTVRDAIAKLTQNENWRVVPVPVKERV